jgi:hypothetical protein
MSIQFSPGPYYEDLPDGRHRKLLQDWVVIVHGRPILIPAGFITDCASIPRFLWPILPPFGEYTKAAILHDWLYQFGDFTRAESDWTFLEAMIALDVPVWKQWALYSGVRAGAFPAWNKYQKQRIFMGFETQED